MNLSNSAVMRRQRVEITPLVYVDFPEESVFLLNLSERGMAIQAMDVLEPGRSCNFSFQLPENEQCEVSGNASIVWSDRSGRAGLEFREMSAAARFTLQRWILRSRNPYEAERAPGSTVSPLQ